MFESLVDKMSAAFKKFKGKGKLTEADVKAGMREVKLALLEADVNYKVVKDFIKTVTERAVGAEVLESLVPAQQVVKIVNEELCALMGGTQAKLKISSKPPTIVMRVGLQGRRKDDPRGEARRDVQEAGQAPAARSLRRLQTRGNKAARGRRRADRRAGLPDGRQRQPGRDREGGS